MIVKNKNTNQKLGINAAGTKIVQFLTLNSNTIKDLEFGTTARGTIRDMRNIIFENCNFNYVTFIDVRKVTFKNCQFSKCEFAVYVDEVDFNTCHGDIHLLREYKSYFGIMNITNCDFNINASYDQLKLANIVDSPFLIPIQEKIEKLRLEHEQELEENRKLRESLKYGYKIVHAPVLVKLSFPEDAELVNINKQKSRASKAKVESVAIIKGFDGEGVTNYNYADHLAYKVGEIVYPDAFDNNPNEDCGHGIHFCIDPKNLAYYATVPRYEDLERILKDDEELSKEN